MVGLVGRDAVDPRQRAVPPQEAARDATQTPGGKPGDKVAQLVGLQGGVTAPGKDQVALHQAALDRAGGKDTGGEAMARPQPVQRVKRRHRLGDRGGRQLGPGIALFEDRAGGRIGHDIAQRTAELCRRDQPVGPDASPADASPAGRPPRGTGRGERSMTSARPGKATPASMPARTPRRVIPTRIPPLAPRSQRYPFPPKAPVTQG